MKYYKIEPDYSDNKQNYLEAYHQWGIPGVSCNVCKQIWSGVGVEYPSIDISNLQIAKQLEKGWCASLEVLKQIKSEIYESYPNLKTLNPGTEFGRLIGKEVGRKNHYFNDFIWNMPWTIVIKKESLDKLQSTNLNLPKAIQPKIKFKTSLQTIYELEVPLRGKLLNPIYRNRNDTPCMGCGRIGVSKPEKIFIEKRLLPDDLDIFRLSNFPTIVLITEKFVEEINSFSLKGIIFKQIEVV